MDGALAESFSGSDTLLGIMCTRLSTSIHASLAACATQNFCFSAQQTVARDLCDAATFLIAFRILLLSHSN